MWEAFLTNLQVEIYEGFCWGMTNISKWAYFKKGRGQIQMEGDWTPLPTMMIPKRKFLFVLSFYHEIWIKKRNHFKTNPKGLRKRFRNASTYYPKQSLQKNWSFPLRISSVNVTTADLVTFTKTILNEKSHLRSVQVREVRVYRY